jgi:hypothetical protein
MKSTHWRFVLATIVAAVAFPLSQSEASLVLSSSLGTTHTGNLVTNGSFENGAPAPGFANANYWATGTTLTPFAVPAGWSSSGGASSYAYWGSDGTIPNSINGSDAIPDGSAAMYFGNGAPAFVDQPPTFNANGTVSFPAAPNFTTIFSPVPVVLSQTINTPATPSPAYNFSFWISGEGAVSGQNFSERGIFGLQVTNVLAGDPIQYLAVPNGSFNTFGQSHLYEYTFTPLNPLLPVTINFINWGHFDLSTYGMSNFTTELILDDVIINAVPEPGSFVLVASALGALGFVALKKQRSCRRGAGA